MIFGEAMDYKLYPVEWTRALVRRMLRPRSVDRTQPVPSPDCGQWISAKPRVVDIQAANGRFAEALIRGHPGFLVKPRSADSGKFQ